MPARAQPAARATPARSTAQPALRAGSGVTQYMQLASLLRHRIAHGELAEGAQLPTVAALAAEYGVARITVRQAYGVLASEGLVRSQRGRGTFVTQPDDGRSARLRSAINAPGSQDLRFEILEQRATVPLPPDLRRSDATYASYTYIRKLHVQDGEPFCLVEIYVASEIHARFPPGAEAHNKIAWLVNAHAAHRMQRVHQTMTVMPCDLVLARLLQCGFSTPIAHMTRWVHDKRERIALAGRFWYRGDRFVADMEFPFDMWMQHPGVVIPGSRAGSKGAPPSRLRVPAASAARTPRSTPATTSTSSPAKTTPRKRPHLQSRA